MGIRGDQPHNVTSAVTYHTPAGAIDNSTNTVVTDVDLSLGYHVYRLTWAKDLVVCTVDDTEVKEFGYGSCLIEQFNCHLSHS